MPTTPSHSLPYPSDSDPADVPADIAALAEALDTELDAIAPSQITGPTSGQLLIANSSGVVTGTSVTGDVTISSAGVTDIAAGAVGTSELGNSAVTTAKIDAGAATADKIATNAVTSTQLRDDASTDSNRAVTTNHLRNSAVTTDKLNDAAVTTAKIADGTIATADLANGSVTGAKIASSTTGTATYSNGASAASPGLTARKYADGVVVLSGGVLRNSSAGFASDTTYATLPAGFRPAATVRVSVAPWSIPTASALATINTNGTIIFRPSGSFTDAFFDGITFHAA